MRPEEEFTKKSASLKKKQSRKRRIKVVVTLVMIVTVISLVFYTLDNPDFLGILKTRIKSFYSPDSGSTVSEETGSLSGEGTEEEIIPEETVQREETEQVANVREYPAFLQKIIDFFSKWIKIEEDKLPAKMDIKVYFASLGEETEFVYEVRTINAGDPKIAVENTMRELLAGPVKSFHYPVIPPGTELLDVEIYENTAKINLSQDFLENSLDSGLLDEYVIYTIVNTVTQIQGIDGVVFFIDGRRIKVYGNVDLSIPAIKDEKYLKEEE